MKITILTDNKKSWVIPYVNILAKKLSKSHSVYHTYSMDKVGKSDVLFILSCENIITKPQLTVCKNNIVIHPSRLPNGKGWSPVAWQVLEGIDRLPISLFEAEPTVDSGPIYLTDYIELNGTELNDDIKHLQGLKTIDMAIKYINNWPMVGIPQDESKSTYYKKRTLNSSELDINKSLSENFNLLRVVDNERYPAFFYKNDNKYVVKIYKEMELKEFITHKTRWLNGFSQHMKLGNIDFKTYMRMKGMTAEEFDVLNKQSESY